MSRVCVSLRYQGLARDLVVALKFNARLWSAATLAYLMLIQAFELEEETYILPIPSVTARLQERGFSPAHELAYCLRAKGDWPVVSNLLQRRGYQPPQSTLGNALARERNVRGVFEINKSVVMPERVCLVDDVMTTGATLRAAARTCLDNGAKDVTAWVATRAT